MKHKKNCYSVDKLQDYLDTHRGVLDKDDLPDALREHLYEAAGCPVCREFYESQLSLRNLLARDMEKPAASIRPRVRRKSPFPHLKAAVLWLILGVTLGLGGYRGYGHYEQRRIIREETQLFVEDLFSDALLDIGEYESQVPEGWFDMELL